MSNDNDKQKLLGARVAKLRADAEALKGNDHFSRKEKARLLAKAAELEKTLGGAPPPAPPVAAAAALPRVEEEEVRRRLHEVLDKPAAPKAEPAPEAEESETEEAVEEAVEEAEPVEVQAENEQGEAAAGELDSQTQKPPAKRRGFRLHPRRRRAPGPSEDSAPSSPPAVDVEDNLAATEKLLQRIAALPRIDLEIYIGPRRHGEMMERVRAALVKARLQLRDNEAFPSVREACKLLDLAIGELK